MEKQGLIGGGGISLNTNRCCKDVIAAGIKYIQLPHNVLNKRFDEFFPLVQQHGIAVFTRSVYLQGFLLMPEAKTYGSTGRFFLKLDWCTAVQFFKCVTEMAVVKECPFFRDFFNCQGAAF